MSESDRTLLLQVVTPDRVVLEERTTSLRAPGVLGSFGILYNHAPFISQLAIGELRYRATDGRSRRIAVSGGFLQVSDNRVTLLADTAERADEIDLTRARQAVERARSARQLGASGDQLLALDRDLERAMNRPRIAETDAD